jgi:hypothetical protein
MITEAKALIAVAKAQGTLYRLTRELLKEDKLDGMRASEFMKKHDEVYCHIRDEMQSYGLVEDADVAAADKAAGYNKQ